MKKTLFIGSTCVDVILNLPSMPNPGQDENITSQKMSVGGCAYNVSTIVRQFKLPYTLCSPVGSGIYGDFISQKFAKYQIPVFVKTPELANGCCYCVVEDSGRRTFLCEHGAEYRFNAQWFTNIDFTQIDGIYFCGLEIEDVDGEKIICFLEEQKTRALSQNRKLNIFFAPGPRIKSISQNLLNRIFALNPILHLNDDEATSYTNTSTVNTAIEQLVKLTNNSVIVTEGKNGATCYDKELNKIQNIPCKGSVKAIDTTGAGDSHCGTIIASLKQGYSLFSAVERANVVASVVVTQRGSTLNQELFDKTIKAL